MISVETKFHFIYSDFDDLPQLACIGKCRSVWFPLDVENIPAFSCPKCGGILTSAKEGQNYEIVEQRKTSEKAIQHMAFKK